jgi:4-amino-4-deoxy-L-arabinose transferase-like glycosyltransferase
LPGAILNACLKSATPIHPGQGPAINARTCALLFVVCLLFHSAGTWSLPLVDRDEPRFAEASREMIERADYIVPYFNNHVRFDKPPLTYWAQVASYRIFGQNDFAARFPSAVAAALTALAILLWGAEIAGPKAGWWAAVIFTLSLQTFIHAKAAVADMWLVFFMTLAYWSGWKLSQARANAGAAAMASPSPATFPRYWWWIFYLSLALGFLAKGPIGWVPLLTMGMTRASPGRFQMNPNFKPARGILLMLAVVAIWGVPALIRTHGEFFVIGIGRHVIGRSFGAMEGHGANSLAGYLLLLPYYFLTVFFSFFPWSIKLPWLIGKLWRPPGRELAAADSVSRDRIDNYLLIQIGIIFLIFTLVKTKLPHYTLPAFPMLALLLARHWIDGTALSQPEKRPSSRSHSLLAVTTGSLLLAAALIVPPLVAPFFPSYMLFRKSRDYLNPKMEFGAVDYTEPSLVWYFRSRVKGFMASLNEERAVDFMAEPGPRFVILPSLKADARFANRPAAWNAFSQRGINLAKGKRVDLTLLLKPQ